MRRFIQRLYDHRSKARFEIIIKLFIIDVGTRAVEMKFRNISTKRATAKMELISERSTNARISTFKRSRSFRASAKFMSKIRSHANLRAVQMDVKSGLVNWQSTKILDSVEDDREIENYPNNEECHSQRFSSRKRDETGDLGGIVEDVKNLLTFTDVRLGSKDPENEIIVEPEDRDENNRKMLRISSNDCGNNYWNPIDDTHSYENPTFSLDSSFDSSVSGCLYKVEEKTINDNIREEENNSEDSVNIVNKNIIKDEDKNDALTILIGGYVNETIGNSRVKKKDVDGKTSRYSKAKLSRDFEDSTISYNLISEKEDEKRFSSSSNADAFSGSWLMNRGTSFRFGTVTGSRKKIAEKVQVGNRAKSIITRTGNAGLLAIAAATGSKFHSLQGMEFLEGFGKKKQHQGSQSSNLSTNINPLTAQPSLNIHIHALFSAVEHGQLEKARSILESTDVDVNSVNSDGLSALDVAVLSNNRALAKMLVAFGAREGNRFTSPESLGTHLASLLLTAERRVQELGGSSSGGSMLEAPTSGRGGFTTSSNSLTGCGDGSEDKQLALWERRVRALRKMLLGFDQARPPDKPFLVAVDVIGTTSVVLKFQESDVHDSSICTKFRVQWSMSEDFTTVCGESEVLDMKQRECRINGLVQGQRYHFRAAAGNLKGWSRFMSSTPAHVTPSSWRDLEGKLPRYSGRREQLDALFAEIRRPEYTQETPALQRRNHKKKTTTIKQLFTATSKFQKSLRRGVFLACLLYHEDKILVTNEDFLPVIEVDETYSPSCIYNDFHWLMKVACTWDDVKSLRQDMEKCQSSSTNHFKIKLLQSAAQMQAGLCVQDLGQIYHKPIRDTHGTMVISTVNYVKYPKSVSVLNSRWLPLNKVIKKTITQEDSNVADMLMASIQNQMTYHQLSSIKLTRGLYLGYLKMQSSVDLIQVFVPAKAPNVLPHCKIRDNPHVSAEEWDYLKRLARIQTNEMSQRDVEEKENATNETQGTEQQKLFVDLVSATARRLFSYMDINSDDSHIHRLYDAEVIELTSQVSLIVIVPPAETACSVPGTREVLLQRADLLALPIQVFEMVHLSTYQKEMTKIYSRLSCVLELDTAQAQHSHREAFSSSELSVAKEKLTKLQDLQCQMNTIWKGARWLIDLITFARDRGNSCQLSIHAAGISMKNLLNIDKNKNNNSHSLKRSLLQVPPRDPKLVKSSPGRGSWPGPNMSNFTCSSSSTTSSSSTSSLLSSSSNLTTEFSKSEQQLPSGGASGQYTRKCSNSSNFSSESAVTNENNGNEQTIPELNRRLPSAKSEDTLLLTKYKHSPRNRSVTLSSVSASTSPSINMKPMMYGRSFINVPNTGANTSSNTTSDSLHSLNSSDEYSIGNSSLGHGKSSQVHGKTKSLKPTASVAAVATPSMDSQLDSKKDDATMMPAPLPGILQVYAAYETGLASGTSLKLHVTPRTTAREVVDLVVKQLNMAVVLKGQEGPIYTADELPNFCLVAVIGARERCLRDDFKPLQLQNPWKKGRLYVRQKQDVLAALEHSSKHTAYL